MSELTDEELERKGDYKTLYERKNRLYINLSKRISRLHNIANNLMGRHGGLNTMYIPSYLELGSLLKRVAYGQK